MEFIFFLVVAFIVYSAVAGGSKKQPKQSKTKARQATQPQDWRETYDPGQLSGRLSDQGAHAFGESLTEQAASQPHFKVNTNRIVNTTATVTRKTAKNAALPRQLRFGEKAVVEDKNRARSHGLSSQRAKTLLDGRRAFTVVAIAFLVVYIMGQI